MRLRLYTVFGVLSVALLLLAGCSQAAGVGEHFTLWEGETVRIKQIGLSITAEQVSIGQPGSQRTDVGFAVLQVRVSGAGEYEITLEVGETAEVGGYDILMDEVVSKIESDGCVVIVTQQE